MSRTYRWFWACAGVLLATALAVGQDQRGADRVELVNPFRVESRHGELNVLQLRYEFPGREFVLCDSHGLVAAKGTLRFMSKSGEITFRDPQSKEVLKVAQIGEEEHIKMMGRDTVPIPTEADFPPTSRPGKWDAKRPFGDHLNRVLNEQFPNGYLALQKEKNRIYITNYQKLDEPEGSTHKVRVAIMLQAPSDPESPFEFRLFSIAQERRSRTDWRPMEDEDVVQQVHGFVGRLARRLAGETE